MKKNLFVAALLLATMIATAAPQTMPKMFAHRGGHTTEIPENTPTGVVSAKRFGYAGVELDVRLTKDGKMAVFHDRTINRKMRHAADYSPIEEKISVSDLTFDELRTKYVLASPNPSMRQSVATLDEILLECKRQGMIPMLHSKYVASYRRAQELFGDEWICFSNNVKALEKCRTFSQCLILYAITPKTADTANDVLARLGGRVGVSSMQSDALSEERVDAWRKQGYEVQASIFRTPREVEATRRGVSMHLTDFALMPDSHGERFESHAEKKHKLAAGQALNYEWPVMEYGGVALTILFKGEVEVTLNDKRNYSLSSNGSQPLILGARLTNGKPSFAIRATKNTKLISLDSHAYRF